MTADERLLRAIFETDEQRAAREAEEAAQEARVRATKARKALAAAPELASHLRSLLEPADGRTEGGVLPEMRTPLLTDVTDSADELVRVLAEWGIYWATELGYDQPTALSFLRRDYQDSHESRGHTDASIIGFRAGTNSSTARAIVWSLAVALQLGDDEREGHRMTDWYHDEVARLVWRLRMASRLSPAKPLRESSPRPCPVCGEYAMRAEYFGSSFPAAEARGERLVPTPRVNETEEQATHAFLRAVDGIDVRCEHCGHVEEASTSKIVRWLS